MRFLILFVLFIPLLAFQKNISTKKIVINGFDTLGISRITDSIAAYELNKYDEQSSRQTGIPRMVCHYNKSYSFDKTKNMVFVYYSFSDFLFYGSKEVITVMSTGFPDFISISYDIKTKETRILPEG